MNLVFPWRGDIVAIGAHKNDNGATDAGHVQIFQYNASVASWVQVGEDIEETIPGSLFGSSISLSDDGKTVVIGGIDTAIPKALLPGRVQVFEFVSDSADPYFQNHSALMSSMTTSISRSYGLFDEP